MEPKLLICYFRFSEFLLDFLLYGNGIRLDKIFMVVVSVVVSDPTRLDCAR